MSALWKVNLEGSSGIELHPLEPFGDAFVYHETEKIAKQLEICANSFWSGPVGTRVAIYRTTSLDDARALRRCVQAAVDNRRVYLERIKDALEGIEATMGTLEQVKRALEGT